MSWLIEVHLALPEYGIHETPFCPWSCMGMKGLENGLSLIKGLILSHENLLMLPFCLLLTHIFGARAWRIRMGRLCVAVYSYGSMPFSGFIIRQRCQGSHYGIIAATKVVALLERLWLRLHGLIPHVVLRLRSLPGLLRTGLAVQYGRSAHIWLDSRLRW